MSKTVTVIFQPDIPAPKGHIPTIDMKDPYDPSLRIVVYPEELDDGRLTFELEPHVAAKVLAESEHVFKLWSPAKMRIPRVGSFGVQEAVTVFSVNPAETGESVNAPASENAESGNAGKADKATGKAGKADKATGSPNPRISADDVAAELDAELGKE